MAAPALQRIGAHSQTPDLMFATNAFLTTAASPRHRSGTRVAFAGRRLRTTYRTAPVRTPAPRLARTTAAA